MNTCRQPETVLSLLLMHDTKANNSSAFDSPKRNRLAATVAVGLAVLLAIGLVIPIPHISVPSFGRTVTVLWDTMHGPAFALFAAILVFAIPKKTPSQAKAVAVGVWIFLVLCGGLAEIVQGFVGRSASWHDVVSNTLGVTAGVLWASTRGSRSKHVRRRATAVALLLLCIVAIKVPATFVDCIYQEMEKPRLASFERPLEMIRWEAYNGRISRVKDHATHGLFAVCLQPEDREYSGIFSRKLVSDWSQYKTLVLDITLDDGRRPGDEEDAARLKLIVQIKDYVGIKKCDPAHQFERTFQLAPGNHEIRIPLADLNDESENRKLDLSQIILLNLILADTDRDWTLYLDNVRLE